MATCNCRHLSPGGGVAEDWFSAITIRCFCLLPADITLRHPSPFPIFLLSLLRRLDHLTKPSLNKAIASLAGYLEQVAVPSLLTFAQLIHAALNSSGHRYRLPICRRSEIPSQSPSFPCKIIITLRRESGLLVRHAISSPCDRYQSPISSRPSNLKSGLQQQLRPSSAHSPRLEAIGASPGRAGDKENKGFQRCLLYLSNGFQLRATVNKERHNLLIQ